MRQQQSATTAVRWQPAKMATATRGADGDKTGRGLLFSMRLSLYSSSATRDTVAPRQIGGDGEQDATVASLPLGAAPCLGSGW